MQATGEAAQKSSTGIRYLCLFGDTPLYPDVRDDEKILTGTEYGLAMGDLHFCIVHSVLAGSSKG